MLRLYIGIGALLRHRSCAKYYDIRYENEFAVYSRSNDGNGGNNISFEYETQKYALLRSLKSPDISALSEA